MGNEHVNLIGHLERFWETDEWGYSRGVEGGWIEEFDVDAFE